MAYRKTSGAPGSTRAFPEIKSPEQSQEEAQQLLASFGSRILEMMKAGGNKFLDFDEKYANAVQRTVFPEELRGTNARGNLMRGAAEVVAGSPIRDSIDLRATVLKEMQGKQRIAAEALQVGIPVANVAARYGVPLAGAVGLTQGLNQMYKGIYADDEATQQLQ